MWWPSLALGRHVLTIPFLYWEAIELYICKLLLGITAPHLASHERGLPANGWSYIDKVLLIGFFDRVSIPHEQEAKWGAVERLLGWQYCDNLAMSIGTTGPFLTARLWLAQKPVNSTSRGSPHLRAALICGQPSEVLSFMVGKYITKLPWPNFPTSSGNGPSLALGPPADMW